MATVEREAPAVQVEAEVREVTNARVPVFVRAQPDPGARAVTAAMEAGAEEPAGVPPPGYIPAMSAVRRIIPADPKTIRLRGVQQDKKDMEAFPMATRAATGLKGTWPG